MSAPTFEFTTASPAAHHQAPSPTESIAPMHVAPQDQAQLPQGTGPIEQGHSAMNLGAKGFLMKKMAASGQSSFQSPTDHMVSPCTKKLAQSKQRHFAKGKPLSLSSSFQAAGQQPQKKSSLGQSSTTAGNENSAPF
ncbi:hypothetical protein JCM3775_000036 [Rhodotorula graminis]|uniref:Spo12 family protein n=1 Tax=Rhodotorula graminis (strain WP1) TaxID=578459 RepID=A0A194S2E3_RHOGW|nr:uncharacterized protein RHOBADRAFT_44286 [Rhodotorula graminis WP1]KPV74767.1 hypothetical protein RHOBADRAFT_44286 [Rhodotorula graminis WP1]